jgi:hypothetical protein
MSQRKGELYMKSLTIPIRIRISKNSQRNGQKKKVQKDKTRPPSIANMLSIKNSSMLMISVSENVLVESEWFFTK